MKTVISKAFALILQYMMGQPFCLHLDYGFVLYHILVWILNSISVHLINGQVSYLTSCCQKCHFYTDNTDLKQEITSHCMILTLVHSE